MVVKRKPSRKDKRLQKKLQRLEDELSSDEEEQPPHPKLSQPSKANKQENARSAAPVSLLKEAAESDDDDDGNDNKDSVDSSSSGDAGEEGDVSDAGRESFDETDGLGEDDFLGNETAKADATESGIDQKDGMADVMARILSQEVKKKAPVLAKRRTPLMKDMEKEKRERHRAKEAAEEKRAALNHQLYVPDHKDTERERQLRRIATRGVVALFNAVTKARQAQEDGGDAATGKAGGGGKAKDMSKKDFLEMLKSSTSKTGSSAANSSSSSSSSSVSRKGEQKRKGRNPFLDETPGGQGGEEEAEASWAAIQDDYLMTAPKINDYGSEEEEGDMEGEGMMSESEAE
ncbi:rrp15-like protein [Nannochloropsis oceanica]